MSAVAVGFFYRGRRGEAELSHENTLRFLKEEWGDNELGLASSDARQNLVGLAAGESQSGDEHVGVEDDTHRRGLLPHGVHE